MRSSSGRWRRSLRLKNLDEPAHGAFEFIDGAVQRLHPSFKGLNVSREQLGGEQGHPCDSPLTSRNGALRFHLARFAGRALRLDLGSEIEMVRMEKFDVLAD